MNAVRILLDEHLNVRLYRVFSVGFEAETIAYRGWKGLTNGLLMKRAAEEYDGFLTYDQGIPHQQNVSRLDLRVVVLQADSDDFDDLAPLIPQAEETFREMAPGEVRYVEAL